MYRHLLPSHRRLMRAGAQAQAVVVEVIDRHCGTIGSLAWKLHMRAHLPDGGTRDFWCFVDGHDITEQQADAKTSELDGMFDGEVTRFLEASEAHERS